MRHLALLAAAVHVWVVVRPAKSDHAAQNRDVTIAGDHWTLYPIFPTLEEGVVTHRRQPPQPMGAPQQKHAQNMEQSKRHAALKFGWGCHYGNQRNLPEGKHVHYVYVPDNVEDGLPGRETRDRVRSLNAGLFSKETERYEEYVIRGSRRSRSRRSRSHRVRRSWRARRRAPRQCWIRQAAWLRQHRPRHAGVSTRVRQHRPRLYAGHATRFSQHRPGHYAGVSTRVSQHRPRLYAGHATRFSQHRAGVHAGVSTRFIQHIVPLYARTDPPTKPTPGSQTARPAYVEQVSLLNVDCRQPREVSTRTSKLGTYFSSARRTVGRTCREVRFSSGRTRRRATSRRAIRPMTRVSPSLPPAPNTPHVVQGLVQGTPRPAVEKTSQQTALFRRLLELGTVIKQSVRDFGSEFGVFSRGGTSSRSLARRRCPWCLNP